MPAEAFTVFFGVDGVYRIDFCKAVLKEAANSDAPFSDGLGEGAANCCW